MYTLGRRVIHPENSPIITKQLEDEPLPPETEQHHEGNENSTHVATLGVTTTTQQVVVTSLTTLKLLLLHTQKGWK
jgi:hypothetical protein